MKPITIATLALALCAPALAAQQLLVPMDQAQTDHLKAYGLTFWVLDHRLTADWLLNYRDGSFLLPDRPEVRREAAMRGVTTEPVSAVQVAQLHTMIEQSNMERVVLEKAPRIAVYTPDNVNPWDDAVTLALTYADIPYDKLWDAEVMQGRLSEYDWLHLHHEDFTGQYSKFFLNYAGAPWLVEMVERNHAMAQAQGFVSVPA